MHGLMVGNYKFMDAGGRAYLPLSSLVMKIKVIPENTVGIPMIRPEKTADPPRCSAYALAEETIIKNENCVAIGMSDRVDLWQLERGQLAWKRAFPPIATKRDL